MADPDPSRDPARERIPRAAEEPDPEATRQRRELCARAAGRALPHLAGAPVSPEASRGKVENFVGYAQVPVGIAGPLTVHGRGGSRSVYVPMATTEGAMVAAYTRGMRVLGEAGGVRVRVSPSALTQCPVLGYDRAEQAWEAARVAGESLERFRALTAEGTRHGSLTGLETEVLGRRLVLTLTFGTGDAIGINMAAQAAERCSADLAARTGARERFLHGQDVEKRANALALSRGRGRSAVADAVVSRELLQERLRVAPEDLQRILATYAVGFARLGTHNWLVQSANGLAAVLLACGQDVAYVTESAAGFLDFDQTDEGDLYLSATLPALLVGTVGGGSGEGTAAECLDLLGCRGTGGAEPFAEILAATVLAGDLSLMAAFCTHEHVSAHERLGRNRPSGGA